MSGKASVSINGGPALPVENLAAAAGLVKKAVSAALDPRQTDLEDVTGKSPDNAAKAQAIAGARLRSIIERVERLEEEKKALAADIRDIFLEAKSAGFDVKVIRQLIRLRRLEPADVEEQETLLDVYRRAIGM